MRTYELAVTHLPRAMGHIFIAGAIAEFTSSHHYIMFSMLGMFSVSETADCCKHCSYFPRHQPICHY